MFRNYLKTAIRSLSRNKVYSVITTIGLALGIAVCLVIFIFIRYEESFDNFHAGKERIYRVMTNDEKGGSTSGVPFPLPMAMETDYPQWQTAGIFTRNNLQINVLDKNGQTEKKFKEKSGAFLIEPSFFSLFNFPWLAGDSATALTALNSIVLTRATAERYFGDWKEAMGKTLKVNNRTVFNVTGILADPPPNTDFQLKIVLPYGIGHFSASKDWWTVNSDHECYVRVPPNVSAATLDRQLGALSKKYRSGDNKSTQAVQALREVHFDGKAGNFSGKTILPERIRTLWLIAAFILVIACVNFINLSTAQAENRAREIGVRKVLGSNRWQLTNQFLMETLLLLSVLFAGLLMQPIGKVLDIPLSFNFFLNTGVLLFLIGITVVITLLAGFYPALVLSAFNPITALKSKLVAKSSAVGFTLRRGLVVFQFIIAQSLIIGTILIIQQLKYFENSPMGFDKGAIVTVPFPGDSLSRSKIGYLRNRLLAIKGVSQVSFNNDAPANDDNWWTDFKFDHAEKGANFLAINRSVDANYLSTYSLPLVAGRNITTSDSIKEFMVNELLAEKLGFSDTRTILNKEIDLGNGSTGLIVGVIKDFHPASLRDSLAPVIMTNSKNNFNSAGVKMSAASLAANMKAVQEIWNDTYPDYVFEYQFLDEKIAGFYKEETQLSRFYKIFAGIAIFLSCLGLYGLASFMATQRIKEVGIRKVLGASTGSIIYLFSREFILLIGIAFVVAVPLTWYFVHKWLENYVYRISISGWVFLLGGLASVIVALMTVSFQAVKAALINPIKNLRTE